jgi:AmiR/NasT family two-component response regulator
MKSAVKTNFRGLRALVVHADDINRQVLQSVLGKLGLIVEVLDQHDWHTEYDLAQYDVVFLDVELNNHNPTRYCKLPCIALIGTEAPSQLTRVVRHGCISHILKPVRNSGVFTALLLAVNEHEKRQQIEREITGLRQRLAGRRTVTAALLKLITTQGIDLDAAYQCLRAEAMKRRIPVEELAREYLAQDPRAAGTTLCLGAENDVHRSQPTTNRRLTK